MRLSPLLVPDVQAILKTAPQQVAELAGELHAADLAELVSALPDEDAVRMVGVLPFASAVEVLDALELLRRVEIFKVLDPSLAAKIAGAEKRQAPFAAVRCMG